jgi:lipopolysaccharide O-acetyltransferase
VQIGNDLFVGGLKSITIGDKLLINSRGFNADTKHDYKDVTRPVIEQGLINGVTVMIYEKVFIGENVCILLGIRIGKNAAVGTGAVVTSVVQPNTVAAGNPAVPIKLSAFGEKTWASVRRISGKGTTTLAISIVHRQRIIRPACVH